MWYEKPILELICLSEEDVVTVSSPEQTGDDWDDGYEPYGISI